MIEHNMRVAHSFSTSNFFSHLFLLLIFFLILKFQHGIRVIGLEGL